MGGREKSGQMSYPRRTTMARDLDTDLKTLRTVLDYAEKRDFENAAALAERTLASGFEHPLLLNVLATRLEQQGKFEDSLRLLERAVAISPTDIGARNALSLCLQRLDRPAEALVHIDHLLKLQPKMAPAHANKGNALIALGLLGRARQSHLQALELDPGNFVATAALASIATQRGEHDEARRWAQQTLRAAPGHPDAVMSLAAAELARGETAKAEELLQRVIVDTRASRTDKARAAGMLGDVLDACGRYAEAFDLYAACNEALLKVYSRFAGDNMLAYVRGLTAAVERIDARDWVGRLGHRTASGASDCREHVFLLGFPRSGTTLLEVALDGHPQIVSAEELELLTEGVLRYMREPLSLEPLLHAGEQELDAVRQAYWQRVRAAGLDIAGKVFIDKHPLNTQKLPLIAKLFPQAKILFAVRDPRDVVLSCYRRRFKMNHAMYQMLTLPGAARFYDAVMHLADAVRPVMSNAWRTVRYETLISQFAGEMRGICDFIGVPWVSDLEDFAQRVQAREQATPSTAQLSRGLVSTATNQWRHYEAQISPLLPVLEPWIRRFEYT
jgi:tetratricopeptide (TPR) repeat protein